MPDTKPASRPERLPSLEYVGPEHLTGIPSRDLTPDDLISLASDPYVQRRLATNPKALADVLVGTSLYIVTPARPVEKE